MKRLLLISSLLFGKQLLAQPPLKVYAYSQEFTPGMATSREIGKPAHKTVYYIYIATQNKTSIQPRELYLNGQWYSVASAKTVKTPVIIEQPAKKTLILAGNSKVIKIELGVPLKNGSEESEKSRQKFLKSKLFMSYIWKG